MNSQELLDFQWPYLVSFLPRGALEWSAVQHKALRRRRAVVDAATLLRLSLAYGYCQLSLREVAAWAEAAQVASISNVALLKRLRASADWLGFLLGAKLAERAQVRGITTWDRTIRLVDATTISKPGSTGTDWRLHVCFSPAAMSVSQVQLTDASGGETLTRFECSQADILIGDRGYAHRAGLAHIRAQGADFIIRLNWQNVPLLHPDGSAFDILAALRTVPEAQVADFPVRVAASSSSGEVLEVRLVATRKSEAAAEADRRRLLKERSKKGRNVDPRTLETAAYVFVLTSLQDVSPERILELYRFRWQIEMTFKRLKSLLELDKLPAKDPALARTFLYSKLLGALLLEDLTVRYLAISPWGYQLA